MSGIPRPFRRRPSIGKIIILWMEYFFLLMAIIGLGYFVWARADTLGFQAYQSWRLDQMQQGKPASIGRFLRDQIPFMREEAPVVTKGAPGDRTSRAARLRSVGSQPEGEAGNAPQSPPSPPHVEIGDLIGKIRIPRLRLSAVVMEGVDARTLRRAVGHVPGTPLPGETGNVDLAGHRDSFFRGLMNVKKGDLITMATPEGDSYSYRVSSLQVMPPNAMRTINSYDGSGLNLITCYPFYYVGPAPKRYVVHANELSKVEDDSPVAHNGEATEAARLVSLHEDGETWARAPKEAPASRAASHRTIRVRPHPAAHKKAATSRTIAHATAPSRTTGIRGFFHRLLKGGNS